MARIILPEPLCRKGAAEGFMYQKMSGKKKNNLNSNWFFTLRNLHMLVVWPQPTLPVGLLAHAYCNCCSWPQSMLPHREVFQALPRGDNLHNLSLFLHSGSHLLEQAVTCTEEGFLLTVTCYVWDMRSGHKSSLSHWETTWGCWVDSSVVRILAFSLAILLKTQMREHHL